MIFESPYVSLAKFLYDAMLSTKKDIDGGDLVELKKEEDLQEISMPMAERQAKVAQELAIAERIRDAAEVSIEEYYDNSIEAKSGLGANVEGVSFALGGKSGAVSKRVFSFKGNSEKIIDVKNN